MLQESQEQEQLQQQVKQLVNQSPIVVFIKGDAARPYCKFSKQLIQLLASNGIVFSHVNVRDMDQQLYAMVKKMANFPTFPQVYIDGELVGGLDITTELLNDGTLISQIEELQQRVPSKLHYSFSRASNTDNGDGSSCTTTLVKLRLSNGTFVAREFDHNATFEHLFKYAGEHELTLQSKKGSDLLPFVLCSGFPFEAYDSRSLTKTLKEVGYVSEATLMVYYPPDENNNNQTSTVDSTVENKSSTSQEATETTQTTTTTTVNKSTSFWPLLLFGMSAIGMISISYWRSKRSKLLGTTSY